VTLLGVVLSTELSVMEMGVPRVVYLFGFLGATVYAFTSFAKRFDEDDRYRLKMLSRTVAVFPLVAGVYLLAFAFPGTSGGTAALNATEQASRDVTSGDRLLAGLVFLAGLYVSMTLKALGTVADRLLRVPPERAQSDEETEESDRE
jgi:hypothetical protein